MTAINSDRAKRQSSTMSRRDAVIGVALLATAGAAWVGLPRQRVTALEGRIDDAVPTDLAGWKPASDDVVVLPPEDERGPAGQYEEQVLRSFVNDRGSLVMLVIAYDRRQTGMLMVHRPESCYPGSGFTILDDRAVTIPLGSAISVPGRFLTTQRDTRVEQVLYWTRLGNEFPDSWDAERRSLAMQNLRGLAPDGALIRASIIDQDPVRAQHDLTHFLTTLFDASSARGRALLIGPANASAEMV